METLSLPHRVRRMLSTAVVLGAILLTTLAGVAHADCSWSSPWDCVGDAVQDTINFIGDVATSVWDKTTGPRCYAEVLANPLESQLYADVLAAKAAGLLKSRAECENATVLGAALAALGTANTYAGVIGEEGGHCACYLAFGSGETSDPSYQPPYVPGPQEPPPSITGNGQTAPCTPNRFDPVEGAVDTANLLGFWGDTGQTASDHIAVTISDYGNFDNQGTPVLSAHVTEKAIPPACFHPLAGLTLSAYVKYVALASPFTGDHYDTSCATGAIQRVQGTQAATTGIIQRVQGTQAATTGIIQRVQGTQAATTGIIQNVQPVYVKAITKMPLDTVALAYTAYSHQSFCGYRLRYMRTTAAGVVTDVMLSPTVGAIR